MVLLRLLGGGTCPGQHLIKIVWRGKFPGKHDGGDLADVRDVLEWIGIQQDKIVPESKGSGCRPGERGKDRGDRTDKSEPS
ncbi:hypothetical protein BH20VER3_BH20VER3_21530 [soil metagenome]